MQPISISIFFVFCGFTDQLLDVYSAATATASSFAPYYPPQWAIEGSSERYDFACFLSQSELAPWWRLDLKILRNIFNVRIVAATTRALLDGLTVYVSNGTSLNVMNEKAQCGDSLTDSTGVEVITFNCNGTLVGQYVYITTSTTGQLAICEVMLNVQTGV